MSLSNSGKELNIVKYMASSHNSNTNTIKKPTSTKFSITNFTSHQDRQSYILQQLKILNGNVPPINIQNIVQQNPVYMNRSLQKAPENFNIIQKPSIQIIQNRVVSNSLKTSLNNSVQFKPSLPFKYEISSNCPIQPVNLKALVQSQQNSQQNLTAVQSYNFITQRHSVKNKSQEFTNSQVGNTMSKSIYYQYQNQKQMMSTSQTSQVNLRHQPAYSQRDRDIRDRDIRLDIKNHEQIRYQINNAPMISSCQNRNQLINLSQDGQNNLYTSCDQYQLDSLNRQQCKSDHKKEGVRNKVKTPLKSNSQHHKCKISDNQQTQKSQKSLSPDGDKQNVFSNQEDGQKIFTQNLSNIQIQSESPQIQIKERETFGEWTIQQFQENNDQIKQTVNNQKSNVQTPRINQIPDVQTEKLNKNYENNDKIKQYDQKSNVQTPRINQIHELQTEKLNKNHENNDKIKQYYQKSDVQTPKINQKPEKFNKNYFDQRFEQKIHKQTQEIVAFDKNNINFINDTQNPKKAQTQKLNNNIQTPYQQLQEFNYQNSINKQNVDSRQNQLNNTDQTFQINLNEQEKLSVNDNQIKEIKTLRQNEFQDNQLSEQRAQTLKYQQELSHEQIQDQSNNSTNNQSVNNINLNNTNNTNKNLIQRQNNTQNQDIKQPEQAQTQNLQKYYTQLNPEIQNIHYTNDSTINQIENNSNNISTLNNTNAFNSINANVNIINNSASKHSQKEDDNLSHQFIEKQSIVNQQIGKIDSQIESFHNLSNTKYSKRSNELYIQAKQLQEQKEIKFLQQQKIKQDKEMIGCTFHPKILNINNNMPGFQERNNNWVMNKQEHLDKIREETSEKEIKHESKKHKSLAKNSEYYNKNVEWQKKVQKNLNKKKKEIEKNMRKKEKKPKKCSRSLKVSQIQNNTIQSMKKIIDHQNQDNNDLVVQNQISQVLQDLQLLETRLTQKKTNLKSNNEQ